MPIYTILQIDYVDYADVNRTFGPIFHRDEFLLPLLELQQDIMNLTVESEGEMISLKDVCNNPLSRNDYKTGMCNIQSVWAYWQDNVTRLDQETPFNTKVLNYLDHFLFCTR